MPQQAPYKGDSRPLIGICSRPCEGEVDAGRTAINQAYADKIAAAGGLPIGLPYAEFAADMAHALIARIDGLLLTGGGDMDPSSFGGQVYDARSHADIDGNLPLRDSFEAAMAREAWEIDMPTLGICRGSQMLNVFRGGTLWRDVREQAADVDVSRHLMIDHFDHPCHRVQIMEGSRLHEVLGVDELAVNSVHHQCICAPAPGARISIRAKDSTPEGIEYPQRTFFMGVQWHPEMMDNTPQLFEAFVRAARAFAASR